MGRFEGTLDFPMNYEPTGQTPLDARLKVSNLNDLVDSSTYTKNNVYKTMTVTVEEDCSVWMLIGEDPTTWDSWKNISIETIVIDNALDDLSSEKEVPSAKAVWDLIKEINEKFESRFPFQILNFSGTTNAEMGTTVNLNLSWRFDGYPGDTFTLTKVENSITGLPIVMNGDPSNINKTYSTQINGIKNNSVITINANNQSAKYNVWFQPPKYTAVLLENSYPKTEAEFNTLLGSGKITKVTPHTAGKSLNVKVSHSSSEAFFYMFPVSMGDSIVVTDLNNYTYNFTKLNDLTI